MTPSPDPPATGPALSREPGHPRLVTDDGRTSGSPTAEQTLPCGTPRRRIVELVATRADPAADPHVHACEYCGPLAARLAGAFALLQAAREVRVEPPAGLVPRVVRRVTAEMTRCPSWIPAGDPDRGSLQVRDRVLEALVRTWVAQVDDVRTSDVSYDGSRLTIEVATDYGVRLPELATSVRTAVTAGVAQSIGTVELPVDVRIVDVRLVA